MAWSYQSPATLMWSTKCSSGTVLCSALAISLFQLWICWPCAKYSGPSKVLGAPQGSYACSAVIFSLPLSNNNTQGLDTDFLGTEHIHSVAMAIVPRGKNLSATDCCERKMSNMNVMLQHSLAYLNITNFMLNTEIKKPYRCWADYLVCPLWL